MPRIVADLPVPDEPLSGNPLPVGGAAPVKDELRFGIALPYWDETPSDVADATRQIKVAIQASIVQRGRTVRSVLDDAEAHLLAEISDIEATRATGREVWPVVQFTDIANATVSSELRASIARRGCAVVRGTFERSVAEKWDADIVRYVEANQFFERYRGPADDFFETVQSKPEIYPIYWSAAQMQARQDPRMAATRAFLNSFWKSESHGRTWFDPARDLLYPDRIRRRPPGTDSKGLGTHLDAGTIDLWMSQNFQRAFRHLYTGDFSSYDPWDAAFRTEAVSYPGSTMCSAFRTFQGWTALSEMRHDQGVLQVVPIVKAFGYLLLRPLLDDVADDDLCGVRLSRSFPVNDVFHSILRPALSSIPDVLPGDTVWWHSDMVHAVAPVVGQQGWGNVLYIPAAPWCARNERYAHQVGRAFLAGRSPEDFPEEHYEADWSGRFDEASLNDIGRRGMALAGVTQPG